MKEDDKAQVGQIAADSDKVPEKPERQDWQRGPMLVGWLEQIAKVPSCALCQVVPLVSKEPSVPTDPEIQNETYQQHCDKRPESGALRERRSAMV
jgi:hypothetical protein